jgi:hypothetical protein
MLGSSLLATSAHVNCCLEISSALQMILAHAALTFEFGVIWL